MAAVYPAGPEPMITRFSTPVKRNTWSISLPYANYTSEFELPTPQHFFFLFSFNQAIISCKMIEEKPCKVEKLQPKYYVELQYHMYDSY